MGLCWIIPGMKVKVDDKEYEVARLFSPERAIIEYEGLFVLVDKSVDDTWELSGEPARGDEKDALQELIAPMKDRTIVTVTPPDEGEG